MATPSVFRGLLAFWAAAALCQETASVSGVVRDSVTHSGIAGVNVTLYGAALKAPRETNTDATGNYAFSNVPSGTYGTRFAKDGYFFDDPRERVLFPVTDGPTRSDGELSPWARLSGRVVDSDGKPASGLIVTLSPMPVYGGTVSGDDPMTDAQGRFEFGKLTANAYHLRATPPASRRQPGGPTPDDEIRREPVPTYFPASVDLSQAQQVSVTAGTNLELPDIRLQTAAVYRVTGTIIGLNGKPADGVNVTLSKNDTPYGITFGRQDHFYVRPSDALTHLPGDVHLATTSADGSFEFISVQEGTWQVVAEKEESGRHQAEVNNTGARTSTQVNINRRDPPPVELRLAEPFSLAIETDWAGAPPAGNPFAGRVTLEAVDRRPVPGISIPTKGQAVFSGVFPGRYRVFAFVNLPGFYADSVLAGGRDVAGEAIQLAAGMPPIRLMLKPGAAGVMGTIEPARPARVLVWPDTVGDPGIVQSVAANSQGAFQLGGLRPGSYNAIAVSPNTPTSLTFDLLRSLATKAQKIKVGDGGTATIKLSFQP